MESVGNVSLNCIFTLESSPVSFQTSSAVPLLAVGAGGVQVKGSCFPVVWSPRGVCWALLHSPGSSHHRPLGWDGRDAAARGCSKAHLCQHPAQASLGSLGVGLDVGQEGQQKPLS